MLLTKKLKGFSLLEISISLLVLGIISSAGLSLLTSYKKFAAARTTDNHIEVVVSALAAYCKFADGTSLPFPSSEDASSIGFSNSATSGGFGIVPYKTLGIMEKFARDGAGKWLRYRMNPGFATQGHSVDMGLPEFSPTTIDKVAFIIKTEDGSRLFWISEKNFKMMYRLEPITPLTNSERDTLRDASAEMDAPLTVGDGDAF